MTGVIDSAVFHQYVQNVADRLGWNQAGGKDFFFINAKGTIFCDIGNIEAQRGKEPADIGILTSAGGCEEDSFVVKSSYGIVYIFRNSLLIIVEQSAVQIACN